MSYGNGDNSVGGIMKQLVQQIITEAVGSGNSNGSAKELEEESDHRRSSNVLNAPTTDVFTSSREIT